MLRMLVNLENFTVAIDKGRGPIAKPSTPFGDDSISRV